MTVEAVDVTEMLPAMPDPDDGGGDEEFMVIELDRRAAEMVEALRVARETANRWQDSADQLRHQLLTILGPAVGATVDGRPVLRREPREVWQLDRRRLRKDYPEVWRACTDATIRQVLHTIKP